MGKTQITGFTILIEMLSHDNNPASQQPIILILNLVHYLVLLQYLDDRSVWSVPVQSDAVIMYVALSRTKIVQGKKIAQTVILILTISSLVLLMLSFENQQPYSSSNPLDGCVYVYLDMGTNIGVQIRNGIILFEISVFS